jgi:Holliday junction resolvasome RuvABC endonuclease subunit
MPTRKINSRNRVPRRPVGRAKKPPAVPRTDAALSRRLQDLTERIDIVLPEVTARVAALEHLLLELKVCTMADLRRAREFVRLQEA